jgi:hypothetical protein
MIAALVITDGSATAESSLLTLGAFVVGIVAIFLVPSFIWAVRRRTLIVAVKAQNPSAHAFSAFLIPALRARIIASGGIVSTVEASVAITFERSSMRVWATGSTPRLIMEITANQLSGVTEQLFDGYLCVGVLTFPNPPLPLLVAGRWLGIQQQGVAALIQVINDEIRTSRSAQQ